MHTIEEGELINEYDPPPVTTDLTYTHQFYCRRSTHSYTGVEIITPRGLANVDITRLRPYGTDYVWTWSRELPFLRSQLRHNDQQQQAVQYKGTNDFLRVTEVINRVFGWHIRAISLVRYAAPETLTRERPHHYGVILEFYNWDGLLWRSWRELEHYYRAVVLFSLRMLYLPHFPSNTYCEARFEHWL